MEPQLVTYHDPDLDIQQPFDVAVVITTLLRPTLSEALKSVFAQDIKGRVQILIGVDTDQKGHMDWEEIQKYRPPNMALSVFWPGYSTNTINGGLHNAMSGGALRSILTFMANAPHVVYLDDDNWFSADHLSSLKTAIRNKAWAYSQRWFVDDEKRQPVCEDTWESVGPGRGVFAANFGGFVDPNCLMIDVRACSHLLGTWCQPHDNDREGRGSDRTFFFRLAELKPFGATKKATASYVINAHDNNHNARMAYISKHNIACGPQSCPNWQVPPENLPKRRKKPQKSGFWQIHGDHSKPFDMAVVIPTIGRIDLLRALRSVKKQQGIKRVQILIGIDKQQGDPRLIQALANDLPAHMGLVIFNPGYSTSKRHGGIHPAYDGGAIRTILSFLAHAPYVAYLDDDNSWTPEHLHTLYKAVQDQHYAYSLRWFIHPDKVTPVALDRWESVGPQKGFYSPKFGGFVDPNSLMIKVRACLNILPFWTTPMKQDVEAMSADRVVFNSLLQQAKGRGSGQATVNYVLSRSDPAHPLREIYLGYHWINAEMAALKRSQR